MNKSYVKNLGWWEAILYRLRLAWYLLLDERVPMWTKTVPALVVAYVLSPLDLIPDVLLGVGQLDDLAIFSGSNVFCGFIGLDDKMRLI